MPYRLAISHSIAQVFYHTKIVMSSVFNLFFYLPIDKYNISRYNTDRAINTDNTDWRGINMPRMFSGKRDVYLEVADRYEKFIRLGILKNGDRLPSVRVAAGELGVNPNTVQKAYTLLEEKGLVCSLPKKGAFVTFGNNDAEIQARRTKVLKALIDLKEQGIAQDEIETLLKEVYHDD